MSAPVDVLAVMAPVVQNYVQFCCANGFPTTHDVESHIYAGLRSAPTSKSYKLRFDRALRELQARRDEGLAAYRDALAAGTVVDPEAQHGIARLEAVAAGHPDNASTQAARRLIEKRAAAALARVKGGVA
ncbi:hypothetical protein [Stenotrophomonas lactitubi]|uniref:hypothetical protein n=1 Tax=Stenotrophomonas lactitubi TaxID=2045214 RepID=UPI001E2C3140|nr:hypothetical protein [Stenotrophomonas lactitubi]